MSDTIVYNEWDEVESDYKAASLLRNEATLRQTLAFDIAPDAMLADSAADLGLAPYSQEVFDAEQQGSQQRRNNIGTLIPLLSILSRLSSEVLNAAILIRQEDDPETDTDEVNPSHILAASVGIIATLVDMGAVHLAHPVIGVDE